MNFDVMSTAAEGVVDAASIRVVDRLQSANRSSVRQSAAAISTSPSGADGLQQQLLTTTTPPRTLVLYSRPSEPILQSDEVEHAMLSSVPVLSTHLADGAKLVPFSVNSLRYL